MKKFLKRLRKDERGNVLYMTVIMMMLLVMFSLVLTNIIYIGVMKIRAQNAADNIALSAATLKARVLNNITNFNGWSWALVLQGGTINEGNGYKSYIDLGIAAGVSIAEIVNYFFQLYSFNDQITSQKWIDRIAEAHGIKGDAGRYEMFPVSAGHMFSSLFFEFKKTNFATYPIQVLASIQPTHTWYVQSRVELETAKYIIGGKRLGFELPDITARARAEVLDRAPINFLGSAGSYWKPVLAPVDEGVDRYMREQTGSKNSGDGADRHIQPSTSVTPAPTQTIPACFQSEDDYVATLPMDLQYGYYREKVNEKTATTSQKIKYYDLKEKVTHHLSMGERLEKLRCIGQLRRENAL